jgi:5-methylcytosine-specific restriction endonuclease McrA/plasmid maintenance system antidote protein VapI
MSKPYHDEEILRQAYYELGSLEEVAEKFGVSWYTIQEWMDRHGIPTFQLDPDHPVYDPKALCKIYRELNSISAVAEELGISENTVSKWMNEFELEMNQRHHNRGNRVTVECDNCSKQKTVYETFLTDGRKFCDQSCQGEWLSENQVGEEHPLYQGGTTPSYGSGWETVRKKVLERDNLCQVCGDTPDSRELDVHHIKPVREFDSPEKAHSLDNLVALCRSCHRKIETLPEAEQRGMI